MIAELIRAEQMRLSHWAGGSTLQLAISPADASVAAQDFQWRFSSATVLQDGQFSLFPAHQRLLALRQGAGMALHIDAQNTVLAGPYHTLRFAGAAQTSARLLAGPVTDINLMLAAGWQGQLWSVPLSSEWQALQFAAPASCTLLCYADQAAIVLELHDSRDGAIHHWQLAVGDVLRISQFACHHQLKLRLVATAQAAATHHVDCHTMLRPSVALAWLSQEGRVGTAAR